jgi:glutamine synthetase
MSPEEKHASFYAGILKHLRAIMAFTNCNASSYERITDSAWSGGRYITWGTQNREAPLRKIEGGHWELKCMDGMANMYLAMAAVLGTGLKGILDGEQLTLKDCGSDPALLGNCARQRLGIGERVPASLSEALDSLDADQGLTEVLGKETVDAYLAVKRAEMEMLEGMDADDRRVFLIDRY